MRGFACTPVAASYVCAAAVAFGLGHFLLGIPIQVSDSFGNMLKLMLPWRDLVLNEFTQRAYLRPMLWAEMKAVFELSGGEYSAWFRGVHVAQAAAVCGLYVHLVAPRTWTDAALVPFGLAVLVGHHSFAGTVTEAFPINTFLTIVICCLAAAVLVVAPRRWWHDLAAVALFLLAAFTVESGLLVWVVITAGVLAGAPGVSRRGAVAVTAALLGYLLARFWLLDVGTPALSERASGFAFSVLEPGELQARFAGNPWPFYAYNVVTSGLSVPLGEPRAGVFRLFDGLRAGAPYPALVVSVVACTSVTGLMLHRAWLRRRAWQGGVLDRDDLLFWLYAAVLAANAVISYPYTKDVIMSPAGAFFALAAFGAARHAVTVGARSTRLGAALVLTLCAAAGVSWTVRAVAVHLQLREAALAVRSDWANVETWAVRQRIDVTGPPASALLRRLQHEAVFASIPPARLTPARSSLFN